MLRVEPFNPYIEELLRTEPWRAQADASQGICSGELDFDGTHHWLCKNCGRVGTSHVPFHFQARSPGQVLRGFFSKLWQDTVRAFKVTP